MTEAIIIAEHPAFTKAKSLEEPWRSHFPKSPKEAQEFAPWIDRVALSCNVLVVANTRVECAWCAYCSAVRGYDHGLEQQAVLDHGDKLPERIARAIFPRFESIPYAD